MTNTITKPTTDTVRGYARHAEKLSDEAPMIVTGLSGWIDFGEAKSATPSWIVPTRTHARTR